MRSWKGRKFEVPPYVAIIMCIAFLYIETYLTKVRVERTKDGPLTEDNMQKGKSP